jgi:hypothetical protein
MARDEIFESDKFKEALAGIDWLSLPILPYDSDSIKVEDYSDVAMWAVDLIRAACERPLWARILLRIALGRFAYREWIGLMDCLDKHLMSPYECYCLQDIEYHRDPVPFDWAKKERRKR